MNTAIESNLYLLCAVGGCGNRATQWVSVYATTTRRAVELDMVAMCDNDAGQRWVRPMQASGYASPRPVNAIGGTPTIPPRGVR